MKLRNAVILVNIFYISLVQAQQIYHEKLILMGSRFDITIVESDSTIAKQRINTAISEISRIEKIISSWDVNSETSKINKNAGVKPVKVSKELFSLIERSCIISELTDGAFDISYASMDKIWKFDGSMKELPSQEIIKKSVRKVGYKNIILNKKKQTVFLKLEGMKIGFGAIGKGYAADKAKELLISNDVNAGIINASGDMNTWGKRPDGTSWKVAITNPMNKDKAYALLSLSDNAIVTSGNYEKYVMIKEKRYSHIINPKTGHPSSGIISVSVLAPSAELADALATSVFVMGIEVGIDRINQILDVDCIIVDDFGNIHQSKNIKINEIHIK